MNKAKREPALDPEAEESIAMITEGLGLYLRLLLVRTPRAENDMGDKRPNDRRGVSHD
jgi:hypothetical protein